MDGSATLTLEMSRIVSPDTLTQTQNACQRRRSEIGMDRVGEGAGVFDIT
ncbi:hypothetical protein GCM10022219_26030 [Microbacterium oryzae]